LLQQGDEILDYRQAQRYYSAATPSSLILTDAHGNHAMEDFEEKLPLVIEFFAHTIK
ncbi:esterase, partial [Acinetobacter baumannii]|nr:esterase [Acinetobacter baumannii]